MLEQQVFQPHTEYLELTAQPSTVAQLYEVLGAENVAAVLSH